MTIRVLTGRSLPRLLRDIVRTLVRDEADIRVEAEGLSTQEMLEHLEKRMADVLIVGCDHQAMDQCGYGLLQRACITLTVVVIDRECEAVLYSLEPNRRLLGHLSTESLLDAIRNEQGNSQVPGY